ncbi:nucleotidyltransferase [Chryseobacterium oncorhynchi]|nr:nucleotidyltransferase [Chryseobacterium oncorhynchi]
MTDAFMSFPAIRNWYELNENASFEDQFSIVSFESIFFDVLTLIVWTLESIFDVHKKEVGDMIINQKVPNLYWYRNLALSFQYGFPFDPVKRDFNNGTATPDEVLASKVIKYAAVTRTKVGNDILISMKIATDQNGEIVPVSDNIGIAFTGFIERAQAAGDNIKVVNFLPDILKINFKICYDPLIILADGTRITDGKYPVQDAITAFLKNLQYNGELSVQRLEASILNVEGVNDLQNLQVQSKWIVPGVGYGDFQPITISKIPESGYFKIDDWTGIEYIIYEPA